MTRYLLRTAKDPRVAVGPETTLARGGSGLFGSNIGNVLFGDSVYRMLTTPTSEVVADAYATERRADRQHADRINAEYDHFVVPLANAFRESFRPQLARLTSVIEQLTIPVTVVGVGAQFKLGNDESLSPEAEEGVARFAKAVLDRSASIGVRGETTRRFLNRLGYGDEHVEVIGCPAVSMRGPENTILTGSAPTTESAVALSISPYVRRITGFVKRTTAAYPGAVYFPQNHTDLALMLWGEDRPGNADPAIPTHTDHLLYQQARMRFPLDGRTWIDTLSTFDYAVGTRIHGTIAALLSRTPATLLAFDSRTLELAEYHEIPHKVVANLTSKDTVETLYAASDWTAYNAGMQSRYETLVQFLDRNGLDNIGQPGKQHPTFDAELAAAELPEPSRPLVLASPTYAEDLAGRREWLRERVGNREARRLGTTVPTTQAEADEALAALQAVRGRLDAGTASRGRVAELLRRTGLRRG